MQSEIQIIFIPQQQPVTNELPQPSEYSDSSRKRYMDPVGPPSNAFDVPAKTMHEAMQQPSCSRQQQQTLFSNENQLELAQGPQRKSERVALTRSNETAEKRASRLQANAERARLIRSEESEQQRAERLRRNAEKQRKRKSNEAEERRLQRLRKSVHSRRIQRARNSLGKGDQGKNHGQSVDPDNTSAENRNTTNATQGLRDEATSRQNLTTQANLTQCSSERRTTSFCFDENNEIRHSSLSDELLADEQGDGPLTSNSQLDVVPEKSGEVSNFRNPLHDTEVRWNDTNDENCSFPVIIQNLEVNVCESERVATIAEDESVGVCIVVI